MQRRQTERLQKLVVILGPTAGGKTDWSLRMAKKFNGEIISADSRQLYKKMTIGTAKPSGEWKRNGLRKSFFVDGVIHHLIDFLDPGKSFSVAQFRDKAIKYIKLAHKSGRMPFLVGGTGLYISSVVDNFYIPRVPANNTLRKSLEQKTTDELMHLLTVLDEAAALAIDPNNKRRIIRALEVCILSGDTFSSQKIKGEPLFDVVLIAPEVERAELHRRISDRIDRMYKDGLLKEVRMLRSQKYSWDLPSMNGIGYRQCRGVVEGTMTVEEAAELLKRDTRRFARRQMTWFKRDERIHWCKTYEEAERLVEEFVQG